MRQINKKLIKKCIYVSFEIGYISAGTTDRTTCNAALWCPNDEWSIAREIYSFSRQNCNKFRTPDMF